MINLARLRKQLSHCTRGLAALEFALLAPVLLMLVFGIIVYSIYFTVVIGVRHAASEGARAAVAGLELSERQNLAKTRAVQVLNNYGSLLTCTVSCVTAVADGAGVFKVTVTYDMSNSPIMQYGSIVPLPRTTNGKHLVEASVSVINGGY